MYTKWVYIGILSILSILFLFFYLLITFFKRVSGSTTTVNKLRAIFNDGKNYLNIYICSDTNPLYIGSDVDFDSTRPDPHAVGTLLKMYLRERKVRI